MCFCSTDDCESCAWPISTHSTSTDENDRVGQRVELVSPHKLSRVGHCWSAAMVLVTFGERQCFVSTAGWIRPLCTHTGPTACNRQTCFLYFFTGTGRQYEYYSFRVYVCTMYSIDLKTKKKTTAVRSRISSKLVFASFV